MKSAVDKGWMDVDAIVCGPQTITKGIRMMKTLCFCLVVSVLFVLPAEGLEIVRDGSPSAMIVVLTNIISFSLHNPSKAISINLGHS